MDFLKAEIERKKRQMQEKGVMAGPNKKYFKRGDLAEKQREEYIAKHAPNIEELKKFQDSKQESKSKSKLISLLKLLFLNEKISLKGLIEIEYNILSFLIELDIEKKTDDLAAIPTLPKAEIVKRLRERGHPILLFGESLTDACERLKQIEMDAPDSAGTQSSGITNDFK